MDKNSIIMRYAESDEDKVLLSHMLDLAERSWARSVVESGNFLSESLKMRAEEMLKQAGYRDFFFWGGYEDAERTCPVFFTEYCSADVIKVSPQLAEITFVRAKLDRFNKDAQITHRDVLGSLMGLGIERHSVGDINISNGCAMFAVKEAIAPFIVESLGKISRYPVKVSIDNAITLERNEDFEDCFDTVASLRLDAVVASVFSVSRSIATEAIEAGLVAINGSTAKKTDMSVKEGDKLSYRGHGRAVIEKIDGLSKKGRIRMMYKKA